MPGTRLHGGARFASLLLHDAGRNSMGDGAKAALLRKRSAQLRSETASRAQARTARSLRSAHQPLAQSHFRGRTKISRADAARSGSKKISQRESASVIRSTTCVIGRPV